MEQEKKWCVYIHINKVNGKVYIGQTCQPLKRRWRNGEGYNKNIYFYRAIQKYGWENFDHKILAEGLDLEEANRIEEFFIAQYHSTDTSKGYNIETGGNNSLMSDASKEKDSISHKKENLSLDTLKKMSEAHKKFIKEKNNMWGKNHTLEARKKMSRPIRNIDTGKIYYGLTQAAKELGLDQGSISKCCQGKLKTCGGYHWEYIDENIEVTE